MNKIFLGLYGISCASGVYCFYKIHHYNNILRDLQRSELSLNELMVKYPELNED